MHFEQVHDTFCTDASGNVSPSGWKGPVIYWMHREFRAHDNRGLARAAEEAKCRNVPLLVVCTPSCDHSRQTLRQQHFLLKGVQGTLAFLSAKGVDWLFINRSLPATLPRLFTLLEPSHIVTDFDTLLPKRALMTKALAQVYCPVAVVDSRNIVPCLVASDKREYGARTLRPKIHRLLEAYLTPPPLLSPSEQCGNTSYKTISAELAAASAPSAEKLRWHTVACALAVLLPESRYEGNICWQQIVEYEPFDGSVAPVSWLAHGEAGAQETLLAFLRHKLVRYDKRNDPNAEALSNLSPYLHFGMLSAQRVVTELRRSVNAGFVHNWLEDDRPVALPEPRTTDRENQESFVEELVVRRELSDNFCWHASDYDAVTCFPDWAQRTLAEHAADPREYLYDLRGWETAQTHDPLWNAAQQELVKTGKIHGYIRMYWCKKILEWSASPEEAMHIAVLLNDKYALDGCDSNGYAGIAWSIGGVHDRGWKARNVYGSIRYMNDRGAARKFDVPRYIRRMEAL